MRWIVIALVVAFAAPAAAQHREHIVTFTGEHVRLARLLDHPGRPGLGNNFDFIVELDVAMTCHTPCAVSLPEAHYRFAVIPDDGSLDPIEPSEGLDLLYDMTLEIHRVSHDEDTMIGVGALGGGLLVAIFGALLVYAFTDEDGIAALGWLGGFGAAAFVIGLPFLGFRNYWEMRPAAPPSA